MDTLIASPLCILYHRSIDKTLLSLMARSNMSWLSSCVYDTESDDDDFELPQSYREAMNSRRKSVFGESYEPDEDDSEVEKVSIHSERKTYDLHTAPVQVIHPKSDAQRRRLTESVKNIFLFKSLDTVRHNISRYAHHTDLDMFRSKQMKF